MLDELFWENSYSAYNFYDYLSITSNVEKDREVSKKEEALAAQFSLNTLGIEATKAPLLSRLSKDLSLVGTSYANSVQMEDSIQSP